MLIQPSGTYTLQCYKDIKDKASSFIYSSASTTTAKATKNHTSFLQVLKKSGLCSRINRFIQCSMVFVENDMKAMKQSLEIIPRQKSAVLEYAG